MKEVVLIFPHQLFYDNPLLDHQKKIILIEHPHFFSRLKFHVQKRVFHRATMKAYEAFLKNEGYEVEYISHSLDFRLGSIVNRYEKVHIYDPIEHPLSEEIESTQPEFVIYETPMFMTDREWADEFFEKSELLRMGSFYSKQRQHESILVDSEKKPLGGKWSFDTENREPLPKSVKIPSLSFPKQNSFVKEAKKYVEKNFPDSYGEIGNSFYPVTREEAARWFDDFLETRLHDFGKYEDAITVDNPFLFHSLLSPFLNVGILTPREVVEKAISYGKRKKTPLNSLEGFIRQIIGWREYVRLVYEFKGSEMAAANYFNYSRKMPESVYTCSTGIVPIDTVLTRAVKYSYAHHIERLMVLGNFFLLCEIDPKDVCRWFSEMFVDAYDWVMIPNVFGMSQYADNGMIVTKPYVSSSKYILKMSDFSKGDWCETWDALYWNFIENYQKDFSKNTRMKMMVSILKKFGNEKISEYKKLATTFLKNFK